MIYTLKNKVIAAFVSNGFEETELTSPRFALEKEGARVMIVSPIDGEIRAWNRDRWGEHFRVDRHLGSSRCMDFDALLLPSPVTGEDFLTVNDKAIKFISDFIRIKKPVVAINRAPGLLAGTGQLKGKTLTSHISLQPYLQTMGARWLAQDVVVDRDLITGGPGSISCLNAQMIRVFCRGIVRYQSGWGR